MPKTSIPTIIEPHAPPSDRPAAPTIIEDEDATIIEEEALPAPVPTFTGTAATRGELWKDDYEEAEEDIQERTKAERQKTGSERSLDDLRADHCRSENLAVRSMWGTRIALVVIVGIAVLNPPNFNPPDGVPEPTPGITHRGR
ncbi:MAG: hypothetical protein CMO80_24740 [Verrucomicrobiales bacterium]|nr:hypothetical protein [Verrucomicrobiales bacterium]